MFSAEVSTGGECMGDIDILKDPEARRRLNAVAQELVDEHAGLDIERTVVALARTACDANGPLTEWPKPIDTGSRVPLFQPVWFLPDIAEALEHLQPEQALELFEQGDLERLGVRQLYTSFLGSGDAPLYTVKQCAGAIDGLLEHQEGDRECLLETGYPCTVFETSALLTYQMVELYPFGLRPSGAGEGDGGHPYLWTMEPWPDSLSLRGHVEAPLEPGLTLQVAARLESLRGKVFDARARALKAIARCLRGADPKAMWRGVRDAILEALSADDAYFLLGIDGSLSGFELVYPKSPLSANGALSALLGLAGHCEKELRIGTHGRDPQGSHS
jgi:hypothetical protein